MKGEGTKKVITELVHFNCYMELEDVLRELDKRGLRPATIEELLAFGAKYPELQKQFLVAAIGPISRHPDGRGVPYLWGNSDKRHLYLGWFGDGWGDDCRFLAVRK